MPTSVAKHMLQGQLHVISRVCLDISLAVWPMI